MSSSSPPAITDWMTGWGTDVLAVGTLVLGAIAVVTLRVQVRANLRAQASRVTLRRETKGSYSYFVIHNASDLPISALRADVRFYKSMKSLDLGKPQELTPLSGHVVAPNSDARIALRAPDGHKAMSGYITFVDAAGVIWSRRWLTDELRLVVGIVTSRSWRFVLASITVSVIAIVGFPVYSMIHTRPDPITALLTFLLLVGGIFFLRYLYLIGAANSRAPIPDVAARVSTAAAPADTMAGSSGVKREWRPRRRRRGNANVRSRGDVAGL